jgi:farnesyl diphosphate synthase
MAPSQLKTDAAAIEAHLAAALADLPDLPVTHAMRYAAQGGKRIRGFLVLESCALMGVPRDQALWPAAAIEAVHAFSLIHDDLPCMDDDDLRRGRPTVHKKWDEATALLAGDALLSFGFELVADPRSHDNASVRAELALGLARASGARGMVRGQALDIAAETAPTPLSLDDIIDLQQGKTGALIEWAATAGPIMAGQDPAPLAQYARALGLAFQIVDDILDVEGDAALMGKAVGKDTDAGKATFVSLMGLDAARARARALHDDAIAALEPYGARAENLRDLAAFVIGRNV